MEAQDLLRKAIEAAQAGERQAALRLVLQVTEQDPADEMAWLWLSDLYAGYPERIRVLERALAHNPANTRIQTRLSHLRAEAALHQAARPFKAGDETAPQLPHVPVFLPEEQSEPVVIPEDYPFLENLGVIDPTHEDQDALNQARRLAKAGKVDPALGLLRELVSVYPTRIEAWLLIAQLAQQPQEKIAALRKAAEIQPDNRNIRAHLKRLEDLERDPFLAGQQHEERGERQQAAAIYHWIKAHSPLAADRMEASRRLAQLELIDEAELLHPVNPTFSLLRLTLGPVVLFGLLILVHSGLNPLRLSLFSLLGEASVFSGSLLVNASLMRPMHPRWVRVFGSPGTPNELEMRTYLRLLGWALLAAPYILFAIEALNRLTILPGIFEP